MFVATDFVFPKLSSLKKKSHGHTVNLKKAYHCSFYFIYVFILPYKHNTLFQDTAPFLIPLP